LHLPQIVDLPANVYEKAMLYAAGIQMGAKVLEEFAAQPERKLQKKEKNRTRGPLKFRRKSVKEFTQRNHRRSNFGR